MNRARRSRLAAGVRRRIDRRISPPSRAVETEPGIGLNLLCRLDAWDDPEWLETLHMLGFRRDTNLHRKAWEWTQCVYGLNRLDALGADKRVLGVGAGHEPILYYLANNSQLTVATDLYAGSFSGRGADEAADDFLTDPQKYAPFDYDRARLTALPADGCVLPFADESFDVVYSLSSIEHFGGHAGAHASMLEQARVLKRGGILCVATEYILEGGSHPEFFTSDALREHIIETPGVYPVETLDETPPERELIDDPIVPPDVDRQPHIVLGSGDLRFTSVIVFFRRPTPRQYARMLLRPEHVDSSSAS